MVVDIHDNHHDARTGRFTRKDTRHGDTDMTGQGFDQRFLDTSPARRPDRGPDVDALTMAGLDMQNMLGRRERLTLRTCPPEHAQSFIDLNRPRVDAELAANPNLTERQLDLLVARQSDEAARRRVLAAICGNPGLGDKWANRCARLALGAGDHPQAARQRFRRNLLANPAVADFAGRLLAGADAKASAAACSNPMITDQDLATAASQCDDPTALRAALDNPNHGSATLHAIITSNAADGDTIRRAYADPAIGMDDLHSWRDQYRTGVHEAAAGTAANPNLPGNTAYDLHELHDRDVDLALAANPRLPGTLYREYESRGDPQLDDALRAGYESGEGRAYRLGWIQ